MNNLAHVTLDGNLTHDPESRKVKNHGTVTSFNVAVNHEWGNKEGNKSVSYIPVETWDKLAENCAQYLAKGSKVTITGYLRQDRWKDDEGQPHSRIKVLAQSVRFDSKKKETTDDSVEKEPERDAA
ncbi:MAG: single-stranded DNA-binding protein [Spirochaetia bacterium]|nr:single-stranded DNA-binding protein [Spirochaetia bacterium]